MKMRICLVAMWVCLPVLVLAGCKSKAETMSRYPYFVKKLNSRWEFIRKSFASESPDVGFCSILLRDMQGVVGAMERSYNGPNRDAGIAGLKAVYQTLYAELHAQVDMTTPNPRLRRGASIEGVGKSIEKAYTGYQEFLQLVKVD
ncbi:MAG: hypothetical protein ACYS5V_05865 [Planctomycetota bacterium]|jgi:hypothetical protein